MLRPWLLPLALLTTLTSASWVDEAEAPWNLNTNANAKTVLEYDISWDGHQYQASPQNWRFPFYSFFLDRYVNGDPSNDDANGTAWEHDPKATQLRHGGDLQGVVDSLDYIHGLGIKGIYLAGSLFLNHPWESDGFSPFDLTILDHHFGNITQVRAAIDAIHAKGMYVVVENTFATMANLYAFDGYENASAPFNFNEYDLTYKSDTIYRDFEQSNEFLKECDTAFPKFWNQDGQLYDDVNMTKFKGCMDSDFNQWGDVSAFGTYPEWMKQLSKFGGVQDRLRDWKPSVLAKINHFSCMWIRGLDIDGFRMDKAMQIPVDSQANFSRAMRDCAKTVGKNNFFIPGEVVNGNTNAAIYHGRGKEPEMAYDNLTAAIIGDGGEYVREDDRHALDAGAFHYSFYRALMRFLGLDGNLLAAGEAPTNFAEQWDTVLKTNDLRNAYTQKFDPRHMYAASNQDVLRWPGLINGTERQLLGTFLSTLAMPGIPMVNWGEEQAFYALDSTADDYIFGRQPMSSAQAWQLHGCYKIGNKNLNDWPVDSSLHACKDDSVSLDHRDPSHPLYRTYKHWFELRERYPVLNDGYDFKQISAQVDEYQLPGSFGVPTVHGLFSTFRARMPQMGDDQDFSGQLDAEKGMWGNQAVWVLYSNRNYTENYVSECSDDQNAIGAPFGVNTTVRNLFYPFETYEINEVAAINIEMEGTSFMAGCLRNITMAPYGWKALVPVGNWTRPAPSISAFVPGHDHRFVSKTAADQPDEVDIEFRYTDEMDCDSIRKNIAFDSSTETNEEMALDGDISCAMLDAPKMETNYTGPSPSVWQFTAKLKNVYDGVHTITLNNTSNQEGNATTGSVDRFMFRIGQQDNPMIFPVMANYSSELLFKQSNKKRDEIKETTQEIVQGDGLYVMHKAAGADKWRFSMSFGAVWSDWLDYKPGNASLHDLKWTGMDNQEWEGEHVRVQYWSQKTGSADHIVEGNLHGSDLPPRRYPHFFVHGSFNQYGFDGGIENKMRQLDNGSWIYDFMAEWPTQFQLNVWGMAANGQPDLSAAMGDVNNDTVLDRISPVSLQPAVTNITNLGPGGSSLSWRILFDDGTMKYYLVPIGSRWVQLIIWILLATIPPATACIFVWLYISAFYGVKFNQVGLAEKKSFLPTSMAAAFKRRNKLDEKNSDAGTPGLTPSISPTMDQRGSVIQDNFGGAGAVVEGKRRCVLIGTMEYDIEDWKIKIKIGGLGVMAQLMGKNLQHQDLVWVVPCAGGIDYPVDTPGLPIDVTILGRTYEVQVQYHKLANITYMLLDAPVFRRQNAKEPYPARMDDLDSAIYYSAWNQCIAEAMRRFPVDLYHINDYHGTVAPLYLLPDTIPCCLSLHNAEFQGLWPMRNPRETEEICSVFNLPEPVVQRYVQFGEVFNLLHAGASILRIHQKGFGAVGVSKKYGKRSWARYPIFWGLKKIGALANPDPTDIAEWDKKVADPNSVQIDNVFESGRASLKRQAQEWAGLEQRADADLFVFVGRWSMQKGIDLIADVFPHVLESHPHTQLLCVGPTIDLYGKFAALKLDVMMQKYPGRVYSKPEFTALPPFIFSGAEFALIPSRDEPFGLVAVEFGRKGALGVGSRVGGLGQMPGWWYTIESQTTKHQMHQFKMAIAGALKSDYNTRATMRARSAKQRFPVAQWKEDLEILQTASIKIHKKRMQFVTGKHTGMSSGTTSGWATPNLPGWMTPRSGANTPRGTGTPVVSRPNTRPSSPTRELAPPANAPMSLGMRLGPGHVPEERLPRGNVPSYYSQSTPFENHEDPSKFGPTPEEEYITQAQVDEAKRSSRIGNISNDFHFDLRDGTANRGEQSQQDSYFSPAGTPGAQTPNNGSYSFLERPHMPSGMLSGSASGTQTPLSTERVVDEKEDKTQQELTPFFEDPTGLYMRTFEKMLSDLNGKNSEKDYCVEEFLEKSEKAWFARLHHAKMNKVGTASHSKGVTPAGSIYEGIESEEPVSQFLLPENYQPPTGLKRMLSIKLGEWPIYTLLLALGQILAANSYQITLLTGQNGQSATQLYCIASVYLAASLIWWYIFRRLACKFVMTLPFFFYGLGFLLLAFAPYGSKGAREWVQYIATGSYAIGSAAGSFFFSQSFGSTGSAPVKEWAFRACAIQGTQQIYVIGMWAWGTYLTKSASEGTTTDYGAKMTAIGVPIALFLWAVGAVLWVGLPDFYRQAPGGLPSFYKAALRRKIIVWFFFAVFVQNFFMSAQFGRNWSYLWSSQHAPTWAIVLLVIFFFVILWIGILYLFSRLSMSHSWILPMFAVALGAPRWCQIWWSVSNMGYYLPWAGGPVGSAILGRCLWLWLGVLDSLQGVGIGMLLLQTLTRFHITFALVFAQVVGSIGTIINRADGLASTGPLPYYPSMAYNIGEGLSYPGFWICMIFQVIICVGYFAFFRKEQLSKP
jgi:alpha-1,3-glucan synthase